MFSSMFSSVYVFLLLPSLITDRKSVDLLTGLYFHSLFTRTAAFIEAGGQRVAAGIAAVR